MSNLFGLKNVDGIEADKDTLGGFQVHPSGLYPIAIDVMYLKEAESGAKAIVLSGELEGGVKYTEEFYFTSGTAKGGQHYTERNGKKRFLPGFNMMDAALNMLIGKGLFDITADDVEETVVKLRNKDGKEEPTTVNAIANVKGKVLVLAIQKLVKNGRKEINGVWKDTNDRREQNQTDRLFNEDGFSINELRAGATDPAFMEEWRAAWEGKDRDTYKPVEGGAAGGSAGGSSDSSAAGGRSLFKK